jgi:hypothetical protein
MRTTTPGPERVSLRFADEVLAAFDFLTAEYGFHRTKVDVTFIRYESRDVFVNVYHGRSSYELGLEIGRFAERVGTEDVEFSLGNIIDVMGARAQTGYTFFQASTPEKVKRLVSRLADLLKEYGKAALTGDPLFFSKLRDEAARKSDDYLKQIQLSRIREQVGQAWHQKNYFKVVELYESVRDDLTPAEIKKLEYARKHL